MPRKLPWATGGSSMNIVTKRPAVAAKPTPKRRKTTPEIDSDVEPAPASSKTAGGRGVFTLHETCDVG